MSEDWQLGYTWRRGMELLSLDFLRPAYVALGVGIPREETLRGLVRDGLLWHLHPASHPQPGSTEGLATFFRYQVRALREIAASALGSQGVQELTHWVQFVQSQEAANPWAAYFEAFLSWASNLRRTGIDVIGFTSDAAVIAQRLRDSGSSEGVRTTLDHRRGIPLSEWDFPLFKARGFLEIPAGSSFFPFIDEAILTVEMHNFQAFWSWLVSKAASQDMEAVDAFIRSKEPLGAPHISPWDLPAIRQAA